MLTDINFRIDVILRRAVAKIAFNYMAYVTSPDFVLSPDFNEVRSFIRHGETPEYPVVHVDFTPILFDDHPLARQTNGHLVTLDWDAQRNQVMAQVSLFNELRFVVLLGRAPRGLWRDIRIGHHFDSDNRQITRLFSSRGLILP